MTYRVLIADDEPFARERLRMLLATRPEWNVVAEAGDGAEAVAAIGAHRPDLVLLDIRMPGLSGIEVMEAIDATRDQGAPPPVVVFVTAYEDQALRAFDVAAIDYLLKPVDQARLDRALARAAARLGDRRDDGTLRHALATVMPAADFPARFVVRDAHGGLYFVATRAIDWIEARGNYVSLHTGDSNHLIRSTMQEFEARLDPARFIRIHRSAIVAIDRIVRLDPAARGEYEVTLSTGVSHLSSRAHSDRLRQLIRSR